MNRHRFRSLLDSLIFIALGFLASLLAVPCRAQSRIVTETAAPAWSELRCTRNADASVECFACVDVTADGVTRSECGRPVVLRNAANVARANALGAAMRDRALSQRFAVDAGAP